MRDPRYRTPASESAERFRRVHEYARRRKWIVTRRELREELGIPDGTITEWIDSGRLHRIHRGVFVVGRAEVSRIQVMCAAIAAAGPGSAIAFDTLSELLRLVPMRDPEIPVHISSPYQHRLRGVVVHRTALPERDVTTVRGIPATTVPRLFLDLAGTQPLAVVEKRLQEAQFKEILTARHLDEIVERAPGRRGARIIHEVIGDGRTVDQLRADGERIFRRMLKRLGVATPECGAEIMIAGRKIYPDFLWRDLRLMVEIDARSSHHTVVRFETDRQRDNRSIIEGWSPLRYTSRRLEYHLDEVEREFLRAFQSRGGVLISRAA